MNITNLTYFYQACINSNCVILAPALITLLITEGVFIVLLILKLVNRYKSNLTDCSLQVRIDKDLESNQKRRFLKLLKFHFGQIYLPSKFSIVFLLLISIVMYVLGHLKIPNALLINNSWIRVILQDNDYQNLIAIAAGIGTIIFALIIFIAESLRDDSERARVLLKESLLYPLTFFGISILLMFLWLDVTYMSTLAIVFLAAFAIYSISQMIRLLLNRSLFLKKEQGLFKDRVKQSINRALRLRVGNNIFLKKLEEDQYNIDYSMFDEEKEGYITISLSGIGVITDINLCAIDTLFKRLEDLANIKDLSLKLKDTGRSVDEKSLNVNTNFSETETKERTPIKSYLLKKLGDELTGDKQQALIIPKKIVESKKVEGEIEKLIRDVYEITSKPQESLSEQLRNELNRKKDAAVEALRSGRIGVLDEISELYISVAISFLEVIKEIGGGYSQKDARKERGAIIGGWDEVKWVSRDLYWLLEEAVKTGNREVVSTLSHIPIAISIRAIQFSDHFVFQEFVQFQTALYRLSKEVENPRIKEFLIDRSWRYLKEMADFYIEAELGKKKPINELENFRDFGIDIMLIFQALLKESFTQGDVKSFELFIQAIAKLFDHFNPSEEYPSADDYEGFLKRANLDPNEKIDLEEKLARQKALEKMDLDIKRRKKELFFGISAWVLSKFMNSDFTDESLQKFWEISNRYLPTDIKELLDTYQRTHGFDTEDFWGWDWWEMEGQPEGVANSIDVSGKFDWLFCVRALALIKDLSKEQIQAIKIEPKRDLVYLIDKEDSPVKSRLNQITENKDRWSKIVPAESFDKIGDLRSLLDSVVKEQELNEQDTLVSATIDLAKVDKFYQEFSSAFFKTAGIRTLFHLNNIYSEFKRQTKKDIKQWGFNQIADKAAFIKDWYVNYTDWGKHYGEELASAEDYRLYKEISQNMPIFKPRTEDFNEKIVEAIESLKGKGFKPSVIFTTAYPSQFYKAEPKDGKFIPHYQTGKSKFNKVSMFIGVFKYKNKEIPVIESRNRAIDREEEICIVDIDKYANLVQYPPYSQDSEKAFKRDIFIFRIIDLNDDKDLRQKIVKQKPDWLKSYSDPERYLSQKVVTNILERFELRIVNKNAGIKFTLPANSI